MDFIMTFRSFLITLLTCVSFTSRKHGTPLFANAVLMEVDRVAEYHQRNYTWPIDEYVPNTPGWKKLNDHRFRQMAEIDNIDQRWEGFLHTIQSSFMAPNFTEHGFALARAPDDLMEDLRTAIRDGVEAGPENETPHVEHIEGLQPWFIDRPDLTKRVLAELKHYGETWVGMELSPYIAYGFRLYRNGSHLNMHVDRSQTHVISFILHIDSSDDAEPWPIVIEDFHGHTHEVTLTSGDLLLYESSKCFHGRPHKFKGSWYSSVFVHYYPTYGWSETDHDLEKKYAVPPSWIDKPEHHFETQVELIGTGVKEPGCPNAWCQTQHSIKWSGPGEDGYLIAPTGEKSPFHPRKVECRDKNAECPKWATWSSDECRRNAEFMNKNCRKSCGACGMRGISSDEL